MHDECGRTEGARQIHDPLRLFDLFDRWRSIGLGCDRNRAARALDVVRDKAARGGFVTRIPRPRAADAGARRSPSQPAGHGVCVENEGQPGQPRVALDEPAVTWPEHAALRPAAGSKRR